MSIFFDETYYLQQNPDVLQAIVSGALTSPISGVSAARYHFDTWGWKELRDPSASFDTSFYLEENLDVLAAGVNPLDHFINYGAKEGRVPNATLDTALGNPAAGAGDDAFNATTYLAANADVKAAVDAGSLTAYQHWVLYGQFEGRAGAQTTGGADLSNAAGNAGSTFALTTGVDSVVGTSGNDTITGLIGDGATLSAADNINGGAGTDTLKITYANAGGNVADGFAGALLNSVELVDVRNTNATGTNIVTIAATGLQGVSASGAGDVTVTALGNNVAFTANGTSGGAFSLTNVAAATNAAVNLVGATTDNISLAGAGLTTATIKTTGGASTTGTVTSAVTGLKTWNIDAGANLTTTINTAGASGTLTVSGAATSVNVGTLDTDFTTVNASGLTAGGLTATMSTTATTALTGGKGNDVITTGAVLTTGSVNAGDGVDTLVLGANVAHANTATLAAKYTNFETLRVNGTFDASLIAGINAIELSGATNNISKLSATQAGAVTALADLGATTLSLATDTGTADVVTLNLGNGTGAAFDTGALTVNGFETLNLKANAKADNADQTSTIASFAADKLTAINLTGSAFTLTNAATTKAVTIDGSALTGTGGATPTGLSVAGDLVTGSTVTGSAFADTFTAGANFATYKGGAGNDTFNATAAQLNTGANYNVIDGGAGTDTLNITGGGALTIVDNNLSKISGVEKVVIATTTTNNQSISTGGWFDAAFKTDGIDLTTTSTTGTITIDMTSFTGAAKLTSTSTTGDQSIQTGTSGGNDTVTAEATTGNVTVSTGAGDDVVKVTTAGTAGGEGAITITTGAGNDTITVVNAAAGDDATITAGTGADKITLGTDRSIVVIGDTDSGITVATADSITGFVSGTHQLKMGTAADGTAGVTHNYSEAAAAVADFSAALSAANTSLAALATENTGNVEAYNVQWDATNAYVFNDTDGNGTADQVIILVGITGGTIAAGDIIA